MIDQAGILMAQGSGIACERIQGVNDNMSQSHYHEYYEIYYLEAGERFHMVEDKLYKMEAGEFIIFPPYVMHHSYGAENMPFKRVLLYFSQEEILWPSILSELREEGGIYKVGIRERQEIHRAMELILKEQKNPGAYHEEYARGVLNMLLLLIAREERPEKAAERKTGARGLRTVVEEALSDIMFDAPSDDTISKVILTGECVTDGKAPEVIRDPSARKNRRNSEKKTAKKNPA